MGNITIQSLSKPDDRHLYAVGRVRFLEIHLLDRDILGDLIEAETLQEVLVKLRDTIYGESAIEISESLDFELMLALETENLIRLIDSMNPDPELTDLFVHEIDIKNLKILFKSHLGNAPEPEKFFAMGRFDIAKLRLLLDGDYVADLPEWMIDGARSLLVEWDKYPKLRTVDEVLDRAHLLAQVKIAREAGLPVLEKYFLALIDLYNVETFLRIRITERSRAQFEHFFVPGGGIAFDFFLENWEARIVELPRVFEHTRFKDYIIRAIEEFENEGTLTTLEFEGARIRMELLSESRYITFGPEPILAYLVERMFELKVLRTIMV
ncbi:MAG TPA: V-type ATPase subunit, partial [Candidatus Sumerlaeota bacterium]|nr:V-type ATPase subunit [Candidatus Sumerlaeota bacterium]